MSTIRMCKSLRDKLIEEVRKRPVLYDQRNEGNKDSEARDQAWLDIAKIMGENGEILRREWKILRDSLRQALKKKRVSDGKKWAYESKMTFLLPHMSIRPKYKYTKTMLPEDFKLGITDTFEPEDQQAEAEEDTNNEAPYLVTENDAMEMFFASVCQSTRRLPSDLQRQVKRGVMEVLFRAEEQLENDHEKSMDTDKNLT